MNSRIPLRSFHSQPLFFYVVMLLQVGTLPTTTPTTTFNENESDRLALLAIKSNIKHDPQRVLSSWNDSSHFCKWEGVTCGHRHRRVTILDLSSRGLAGSLSPYVGNLSFLREIRLYNNTLEGRIPHEVGRLFRLQQLFLYNNSIGGEIPINLSHCTNLEHFRIANNKLVGRIPKELGSLLKLTFLSIHLNTLTGRIPPSIGNLTSLQFISATLNLFEGSIPDTLGQLKNLKFLGFSGNKLTGMIPPSIYNLSFLTSFCFATNRLHGSLPLGLCLMLPHLKNLEIFDNQLTGPLPLSLSNCSKLDRLQAGGNNFSGKITTNFGGLWNLTMVGLEKNNLGSGEPDEMNFIGSLANCSNLRLLDIGGNQLRGALPYNVGNLSTQLLFLALSANFIYGSLPTTIANLVNLNWLNLEENQLTGIIPRSIGNLQKLQMLSLAGNKFSGKIPNSLGNLSLLTKLYLSFNKLEGSIPSSLENCQNLLELILSQNNLNGSIPKQIFEISTLSISLDLSWNQLSGPLPLEISNLKNLMELNLSENDLSGEIPSGFSSCSSLENLYLEGNFFQGSIPPSLSSLRAIQNLDLSRNKLSGQIPRFLEQFSLKNLNLSFNDFEGEVPIKGVFRNVSAISIVGNTRLCGGVPSLRLPKCTIKESNKREKLSPAVIIVISTVCTLLGVTVVSSFLLCCQKKRIKTQPLISWFKESFLKVSYESLLKATDGFSSTKLIGVGSFSTVYQGVLDENGMIVAIKVLNLEHGGSLKSFMAECEALRNVRHRNLVKIVTACSSVDFRGNDFKALVYEFMPNGSLERWLHSSEEKMNWQEELHRLSLLQRINIAIDVACGLDYLHNQCKNPIIHCDLKPSNVLLDRDMVAHVGDFGLARSIHHELSIANQSSSIGIRGTVGYVAPEYGLGSEVSTNGDVYSYGILLLELVTGKRPIDPMFGEGLNLHNFARMAIPNHVKEIVEPLLLTNDEEYVPIAAANVNQSTEKAINCNKNEECLISMVKIGVACSMDSPQDRMDISKVLHELHSIRSILLRTQTGS